MALSTALAGSSLSPFSLRSPKLPPLPLGCQPSRLSSPPSIHASLRMASDGVRGEGTLSPQLGGSALAGALFAALASSDSALASQQLMQLAAADDTRGFALLLPLVAAIAWVLFNILQPALNQVDRMRSAKALAIGLGLGAAASLVAAPLASAAEEIANIAADSDSRGLLLLGVLIPAVGWVLFNILQPALNQMNNMRSSRGLVGAIGLGAAASALFSPEADAAVQELASVADSDLRGLLLLGILVPAVGWVLFNILQPALNQFNKMRVTKGIAGAVGLGAASAIFSSQADAAVQEIASLADSDSRGTLLLAVLIPAVGWVLFNILPPALNQLNKMRAGK